MATSRFQNKFRTLLNRKKNVAADQDIFGKKIGLAAKFFGYWHENLSRPFGHGKSAYRRCLTRGARKQFNPQTLQTYGAFYFQPARKEKRI